MKIQNTITQSQLEMLLRLANTMHSANPAWKYGQSVFNAIEVLLPDLAEEIRGNPKVDPFNWLEDYGARWTQWYAAVCPDEPREMESLNVGEVAYSEKEELLFDSSAKEESSYETAYKHYGQLEEEVLDFSKSCGMCRQQLVFQEEGMCELCLEHLEEDDYDIQEGDPNSKPWAIW